MIFINSIILFIAMLLPKSFIKMFAGRYVAGETAENAISVAKILNKKGFCVTLDILGEHTKTKDESNKITEEYIHLFKLLKESYVVS